MEFISDGDRPAVSGALSIVCEVGQDILSQNDADKLADERKPARIEQSEVTEAWNTKWPRQRTRTERTNWRMTGTSLLGGTVKHEL